jgi:hypothetical protein
MWRANEGGFARAVAEAVDAKATKQGQAMKEFLREQGVPERHDLGALHSLRARFSTLSGTEFDQILSAVRGNI